MFSRNAVRPGLILLFTVLWVSVLWAQVPSRSISGQTLVVSDAELDAGMAYYIWPGGDTHLILESDAFLQRVAVTSNRMVGYVIVPFELESALDKALIGGAFRLPVASLRTGVDGGDETLQGDKFLDLANHPEITFQITGVSDAVIAEQTKNVTSVDLQLQGTLQVKGTSQALTFKANLQYMPEIFRLYSRSYGDVLLLRGQFNIKPSSFDWKPERSMADRVAEELEVDLFLLLSTISPDRSPFPEDHPVYFPKQLKFITYLRDLNDPTMGYQFGAAFMQEIWDNDMELQKLADGVLKTEGIQKRNYAFALKAMQRACELSSEKKPGQLQSLASIYYEMGDSQAAIEWQRKAVNLMGDKSEDDLAAAKRALERYEKARSE